MAKVNPYRKRNLDEAFLLWATLGLFGAHHFYLHRYFFGVLYMCTLGLFFGGWIIDFFRMRELVKDSNEKMENPDLKDRKLASDAYALWFPLGIFGLHHAFLGNRDVAIIYACTFGMFFVGWILDLYFMPYHIDEERRKEDKSLYVSVFFTVSPLGIFGVQHFYLRRYFFGITYACSFGLLGFGYIFDIIRIKYIVRRANLKDTRASVDDAYILWFPLGFLGLHHYYLGRWKWGVLYSCTFGLFFIGWIVDGFRLKKLVRLHRLAPKEGDADGLTGDNAEAAGGAVNENVDTMPEDGNVDTMPEDGNIDTMPEDGNIDTMPGDGNVDTMPEGDPGAIPSAPPESELAEGDEYGTTEAVTEQTDGLNEGETGLDENAPVDDVNADANGTDGVTSADDTTVGDTGEEDHTKVPTALASLSPDQVPSSDV